MNECKSSSKGVNSRGLPAGDALIMVVRTQAHRWGQGCAVRTGGSYLSRCQSLGRGVFLRLEPAESPGGSPSPRS